MSDKNNGFIEEDLEDDGIFTLTSSDGKNIEFLDIAGIPYKGNFYVLAQPVELFDGMAEDEVLVFLVDYDENNNEIYRLVIDDEVLDAVSEEYTKLYNEAHLADED